MSNKNTISVQLTVNDDGSVVMKQFGKNSEEALNKVTTAAPKTTSALNNLKSSYLEMTAKAATAYMAVVKAMDYMDKGAQALQVASSFEIMAESADANAERMIAKMKSATKETIDDSAMMQKAIKMMTLGYDPSQIERFSKVIITASQIAGTSSAEAYDRLADSISTRMPRALVQMGAATKSQMKVVTEAINAGIDETVLYELAMTNLELKQKMLQGTQDQATLAMQRFKAQAEQTKEEIGIGLLYVTQRLYAEFQYLAAGTLGLTANMAGLVSIYARYRAIVYEAMGDEKRAADNRATADAAMEFSKNAWGARNELIKKSYDNMMGAAEVGKKATAQELADSRAAVEAIEKKMRAYNAAITAKKNIDDLMKSWREAEMTLNAKIEGGGMSELQKDLIANQLEADKLTEKYGKIKGAIDLIQKAQEAADTDAIIKAENKALEAFETRVKEETERDKQIYEKRQQEAQERLTSERDIYQDLRGYEDSYYAASVALIEKQAERYRELKINEVAIEAWATEEKRKAQLLLYRTVAGAGTFGGGLSQGLTDYNKSLGTYFTQGEELAKNSATAMHDSYQNIFFDAMKGNLKSFDDYWQAFTDSLFQAFSKMLADMLMNWITTQAMMKGGSGSGLMSTLIGFGTSLLGSSSVGADTSTPAGMNSLGSYTMGGSSSGYASYFHGGHVPGESPAFTRMIPAAAFARAPRYHDGFAPNEIPAVLTDDESVFTPAQVKALGRGRGDINLSFQIPISSDVGSKKMIVELQNELPQLIKNGAEEIIRRHS
ncbi:MAG: hypothetical protein WC374_04190 [Phycisphaerae bacterium]|jgi:hypothetical protein